MYSGSFLNMLIYCVKCCRALSETPLHPSLRLIFRQKHPNLINVRSTYATQPLPYIKIRVDREPKNGMYYLTGSQMFHMMKNASRQSPPLLTKPYNKILAPRTIIELLCPSSPCSLFATPCIFTGFYVYCSKWKRQGEHLYSAGRW